MAPYLYRKILAAHRHKWRVRPVMGTAETIVAAPHQGGVHKGKPSGDRKMWEKIKKVLKVAMEVAGFFAAIKTLLS